MLFRILFFVLNIKGLMSVKQIHSSHSRKTKYWGDGTQSQFCTASASFSITTPLAVVEWQRWHDFSSQCLSVSCFPLYYFYLCGFLYYWPLENWVWYASFHIWERSLTYFSLDDILSRQSRKRSQPDEHLTCGIKNLLLDTL